MKKTLYILLAVFGLCLLSGCGSDDKEKTSPLAGQLAGEWHLASWVGNAPAGFDAYVSFASDGSFEIYQRIEQVYYQKFTGSYQLRNESLSGRYSDQTPWNSTYEISFDETGNTLTMVSDPAQGEVSVYRRTPIPVSVKGDARVSKAVRTAARRLL